jgi:hypothetical protein
LACGSDFEFKQVWGHCNHYGIDSNKYKQATLDKFYHYDLDVNISINVIQILTIY